MFIPDDGEGHQWRQEMSSLTYREAFRHLPQSLDLSVEFPQEIEHNLSNLYQYVFIKYILK